MAGSATFLAALRIGARSMLQRPGLAAVFLGATVLQGGLQGGLIWALRRVLLHFSEPGGLSAGALLGAAALILFIWLLRSYTAYLAEMLSVRLAHRVEHESMLQVLVKLLSLSVRFFDRHSRADIVMASYHDLKGVRTVTIEVGRMVLYAAQLVGLAAAACLMSPKLAVIGLVTAPLGLLPAYWLGQRITRAASGEREAVVSLWDSFHQVASGIRIIKVSRAEGRVLESAARIARELQRRLTQMAGDRALSRLLLEAASGIGIVLVLTLGAGEVAAGRIGWQSLLGLLIAIMAVYNPLVGLLQLYTTVRAMIPSLDRIDTVLCERPDVDDRPAARSLPEAPDMIELESVSFSYGARPVLRGLSARFRRGETIGIVGASGAGKSTLLALLLRFYDPTEGRILLDGADLRDIRHADLMDRSAIVLQDAFLFTDSVANNIRAGRVGASFEEVIAAARAAQIDEEIRQMERGYDTVIGVGKGGRPVSGGQRQRICIAAALLKNAPLLFLDEATSNLDSLSEMRVQAAITTLMQGRTTFVIAHRLSTLRHADRILVLDDGWLVGQGSHEDLLRECPRYRALWGREEGRAAALAPASARARVVDG